MPRSNWIWPGLRMVVCAGVVLVGVPGCVVVPGRGVIAAPPIPAVILPAPVVVAPRPVPRRAYGYGHDRYGHERYGRYGRDRYDYWR